VRGTQLRLLLGIALAVVPALAACGGDGGGGGGGNAQGEGQTAIRYSWWGSGERNERTTAVIDLFEKAHQDIDIKGEPVGDFNAYWERLTVQSTAKGAPCLPQMQSRYMSDYSSRNTLRPLDEYVEQGLIDISDIPEPILETGRGDDGKLYSVPTGVFFYASMYNETMAEEAGIPAPPDNWTWEDWEQWLRDAAEKLPEGKYAADLFPATDFSGAFFNYVFSHGGEIFGDKKLAFDRQLLVDWWTMWDEMRKDGVTITAEMLAERGQAIEEYPISTGVALWNTQPQNQLTQTASVAEANDVGNIVIGKLPDGPQGPGENFGSNGLSISTSCPEEAVENAVKFIEFFLNDEEAAKAYGSTNGAVSVTKLRQQQIDDPNQTDVKLVESLRLVQEVVDEGKARGLVFPVGGRAVSDAFTRAATSVFQEQATPEEAADAFIAEANAALAAG
jgi:multiple sugar transport system substrate-binding protein